MYLLKVRRTEWCKDTYWLVLKVQSGPAASVSVGDLLKVQIIGLHLKLAESETGVTLQLFFTLAGFDAG